MDVYFLQFQATSLYLFPPIFSENYFLKILHSIYCADLTHWSRVTHICGNELTVIDSDNGLSPSRRQAIIWTNAGILSIEP